MDASDIVQDVLLEANQRLVEYLKSPVMPFHLWLRHLAKDRIIDTHRRHRQAQRRSIDREQPLQRPAWADASSVQLVAQLVDGERTPASAAIQQELQSRLNDAVARLKGIEGIAVVHLGQTDIVRNPLVQKIVEAYDDEDGKPKKVKKE